MADERLIRELDEYLGTELGRRADGHAIFKWKNSDQCFWPAFATGRTVTRSVEMLVPIIGGGQQPAVVETLVPEYRRDRQMRALDTWVVTKWLTPEQLIWGWIGRHGGEIEDVSTVAHPSYEQLVEIWNGRFPGADFPHNGWRVPTDATLPRSPHDPYTPNWQDTRYFVERVKDQTSMSGADRIRHMLESEDANKAVTTKRMEDEIRDSFPAFLNPKENWGKRGGWISFPWTKQDKQ